MCKLRRAGFKSKGSLALLEVPMLTLVCLVDLACVIAFRVCSALDFPCVPCKFKQQVALHSAFCFHATTETLITSRIPDAVFIVCRSLFGARQPQNWGAICDMIATTAINRLSAVVSP